MQTIYLGPKTRIEHEYEESQSQVQGSWKVVADGPNGVEVSETIRLWLKPSRPSIPISMSYQHVTFLNHRTAGILFNQSTATNANGQEYFLFADSPEEKETILEGLKVALE